VTWIKAKKALGQNFLVDKNIAAKIVKCLEIEKNDLVVEIGPGTGLLTEHIFQYSENMSLIELDQRAIEVLQGKFMINYPNISIVHQDFRKINLQEIFINNNNSKILVIGNIPYYITGDIFFKLFENSTFIKRAIITVQKEVAQRIIAKTSTKDYGILTIAAAYCCESSLLFDIPAECFVPKPNVTSSVVLLNFKENFNFKEFKKLLGVVKQAFNQRRKMLSNTLKGQISEKYDEEWKDYKSLRPENLLIDDFMKLLKLIENSKNE